MAAGGTSELQQEERRLGSALAKLLVTFGLPWAEPWISHAQVTHLAMFASACRAWGVETETAVRGYLFSWVENAVSAAVKVVPLGQSAGQRIVFGLAESIDCACTIARTITDDRIGAGAVGQLLASSFHETQYSRLFRS